jgi:hypothetical protein
VEGVESFGHNVEYVVEEYIGRRWRGSILILSFKYHVLGKLKNVFFFSS